MRFSRELRAVDWARLAVCQAPLALLVLAVACATPYQPRGLTGGFADERIDDSTYKVTFNGNGHSKQDRVWSFWIYRCAELTRDKGYAAFGVTFPKSAEKTSGVEGMAPASAEAVDAVWIPVKGGGTAVPHYYYVPGQTITRWNASGVVHMFKPPYALDLYGHVYKAETILVLLRNYIDDPDHVTPPDREILLRAALLPRPLGLKG